MDLRALLAYIGLVAIWGSTWAAIKVGVSDVPAWVFAFDRAVIVAAVLIGVSLALRLRFPRQPRVLAAAAVTGIINTGSSWAIIFWAEQFVPSGLVAMFGATVPIWTALFAHYLVRGDRLTPLKGLALSLGFVGVALLVGASGEIEGGPAVLAGILLALMPVSWAIAGILSARLLAPASPLPVVGLGTLAGAIFLVPFALAEIARPAAWTSEAIAALVYLALVGSCVGLVLNMWLYRRLRPTTIALAQLLITAEAALIGAFVLGEEITAGMLAGAAMIAAAIALNARLGSPVARPTVAPEQAPVGAD